MTESENYYSEAEVQELMQELEQSIADREQMQQRIDRKDEKIQQLSSDILTLKKELQIKSDRLVKQSEADNVLKQNEELQRKNAALQKSEQNARDEAAAEVSAAKKMQREAQQTIEDYESRQKRLEATIEARAERKVSNIRSESADALKRKINALEKEFKAKEAGMHGFQLGTLLYGLLVTLLAAFRSSVWLNDFVIFFQTIWKGITAGAAGAVDLGDRAATAAYKIPQEIIAAMLHYVLLIAVPIVLIGGTGFLSYLAGKYIVKHYRERLKDNLTLAVTLISIAVTVFLGDLIRQLIPVNLIALLIIVQAVYVALRAFYAARHPSYY